jgi:lipid-A-disaccharide synthase-like uncharacterized protein
LQSMNDSGIKKKDWRKVVLSYILSGVTGLIGLFYWFSFRKTVNIIMVNSSVRTWSWQFIDLSTFIFFGIVWLILVLLSQYLYEKELVKRWIPPLFMIISVIQGLLFLVSYLVMEYFTKISPI